MRYGVALISLLVASSTASFESGVLASALVSAPSDLVATGRTDTTLNVQWQANGNTLFTLDYLGPEAFGGLQPTCNEFPQHNNVLETGSDVEVIEGLQPSTWYHIHVHALDPATHLVVDGSTNVIIVKTGAAGSGVEALAAGSSDYIICGGGDGDGGDDDGCAIVTFVLLPGSEPFEEVQVTLVDPPTGNELDTFAWTIGEPQSVPAGSYHLRFSVPDGYAVTSVQRGLNVSCGDDITVRLRVSTRSILSPSLTAAR